jgi:nucleoside-diphosphate-sugar epimerase
MKALVTGANGFTGSHLVKTLLNQGYNVKALVRKTSNLSRLKNLDLELVYGDVTDQESLKEAIKDIDVIFHIAAYVELGLVNEEEMREVNVEGTRNILELALDYGVKKMVYCSTIGVFGDTQGKVIDEGFQRTQKDFSSAYDLTKYEAQKLVDKYAEKGLPVVSVMPSGILGADDPHFGPVFKLFLNNKLKLWVGGDRVTGVVHVDDLVDGIILASEKGKVGDYYILSSGDLTLREMFAILGEKTGISVPKEVPKFLAVIAGNVLDIIGQIFSWNPPLGRERLHYVYERCVRVSAEKACRELGWNPRSVNQTLMDILHDLENND